MMYKENVVALVKMLEREIEFKREMIYLAHALGLDDEKAELIRGCRRLSAMLDDLRFELNKFL